MAAEDFRAHGSVLQNGIQQGLGPTVVHGLAHDEEFRGQNEAAEHTGETDHPGHAVLDFGKDDEQVHVAVLMRFAAGARAEKDDAARVGGLHEAAEETRARVLHRKMVTVQVWGKPPVCQFTEPPAP